MAIVILRNDGQTSLWKEALRKADPNIAVYGLENDVPLEEVRMAAVWKHPPGSLNRYPNLKGVHCLGAGVDFILEDKSIPEHFPIMRVVDPYLASDMAEFVLGQILNHLKNLNKYKQDQLSGVWDPRPYHRIKDIRVGIMGVGKLGMAVAELLQINGFSLVGWTNDSRPSVKFPIYNGEEGRNKFLRQSDILVCLLPLTEQTRGILNKSVFDALPERAYLINVARGPLLEDMDLIQALNSGKISGAGLDVFHTEPLPESNSFWKHPWIHMTPHVASVSDPDSVVFQILENYKLLQEGKPLKNQVSRERGY